MGGPTDWPGDETAETQALGLPAAERQVLVALAVVGQASLSADELADLGLTADVIPPLADLERRGLVRLDERRRYSVLQSVGEQLRRTDSALATGDRLLSYFTTLARNGMLTPARLDQDADAILGLTAWAADVGRFVGLLELVRTLQSSFGIAQRTGQWLTLLDRGRTAARVLGDRRSEIWSLEQMATATAAAGDAETAQRFLRAADELRQERPPPAAAGVVTERTAVQPVVPVVPPPVAPPPESSGGFPTVVLWILGLIAALAGGVALGFLLDTGSSAGTTTAQVSVTLTRPGTTETAQETVTLPATTVVTTSFQTTTETVTATTTTVATTTVIG